MSGFDGDCMDIIAIVIEHYENVFMAAYGGNWVSTRQVCGYGVFECTGVHGRYTNTMLFVCFRARCVVGGRFRLGSPDALLDFV